MTQKYLDYSTKPVSDNEFGFQTWFQAQNIITTKSEQPYVFYNTTRLCCIFFKIWEDQIKIQPHCVIFWDIHNFPANLNAPINETLIP